MEKTKHTPGPWLLCDSGAHNCYAVHADDASCIVAYTMPRFKVTKQRAEPAKPSDEDQANARLIAAAPELLEALKNSIYALQSFFDDCPEEGWEGTYEPTQRLVIDTLRDARLTIAKATGK